MKKLLFALFALVGVAAITGCSDITVDEADVSAPVDNTQEAVADTEEVAAPVEAMEEAKEEKTMPGFSLYNNTEYKFSMEYPNAWEMKEDVFGSHVMFFVPLEEGDLFKENVGVITEKLNIDIDVEEYYAQAKVHLVDFIPEFKEVSKESVKIAGVDGMKVQYLGSQGNYTLQRQQVFFIKDQVAYVVTYTAEESMFDKYVEDVNKMIGTFALK